MHKFIIIIFLISICTNYHIYPSVTIKLTRSHLTNNFFVIPDIEDLCEDTNGNFYVLSSREKKIIIFNHKCEHIKSFGRKGNGPGDLKWPTSIDITKNGHLVICEARDIVTKYSRTGSFIEKINLSKSLKETIFNIKYAGNQLYYGEIKQTNTSHQQIIIDFRAKKIINYLYKKKLNPIKIKSEGKTIGYSLTRETHTPNLLYKRSPNNSIAGFNQKKEISIINSKGIILKRIKLISGKLKFTASEIENTIMHIKQINWPNNVQKAFIRSIPDYKNILLDIHITNKYIWTSEMKKNYFNPKEKYMFKIYNLDGNLLGYLLMKHKPIFITDQNIYFSYRNQDDDLIIKKCEYELLINN